MDPVAGPGASGVQGPVGSVRGATAIPGLGAPDLGATDPGATAVAAGATAGRGRHVAPRTAEDPSLRRIASLVVRSAVLPGTGHLATGHRRTGWVFVTLAVLVLAGLAVFGVAAYLQPDDAASYAVRTRWLTALEVTAVVVAVGWIGVLVRSAFLARPGDRGTAGRLLATVLVLVLGSAVALPAAVAARYADVQRAFVNKVFDPEPSGAGGTTTSTTPPDEVIAGGRLNVLLVGSDAGPDRTGVRTDTMILASLDTRTGRTVLFTLPRNLERVPFEPGSVMNRQFPRGFNCGDVCLLNAVYQWAVEHPALFPGDPDPGMTALRSAVSATLGVRVDYHAVVDLAGFSSLVDALGGVTIRVERRLPIGGLDAEGNHVKPSGYIQPGLQKMNGETALAYARSRSDSSDYERVQRQRCLLGGLQREADPRNLLTNFTKLASSTADALQTDLPRALLPDLVKLAFKVKQQPIESLTFTPPLINVGNPDFAAIRLAVATALVAPAATPSPTIAPPSALPSAPPSVSPTPSTSATPDPTPVSVADVCQYQ